MNWFETKISYDTILENGMQKQVTDTYLIDALSFTEAEERIIEEMKPRITGNYTIITIKRYKLSEIFVTAVGERYFKAKVLLEDMDKKKKTPAYMLIHAADIEHAHEVLKKEMTGTLADWECASMIETKIMDVFVYKAG